MKTKLNEPHQNVANQKFKVTYCLPLIILLFLSLNSYSIPSNNDDEKVDIIIAIDNSIYLSKHFRYPDIKNEIKELSLKTNGDRLKEYTNISEQNLHISLSDSAVHQILLESYRDTSYYRKEEKKRYKEFNKLFRGNLAEYLAFNILELHKPSTNIEKLKYFVSKIQHLETMFQIQQKLELFIENELVANHYIDELSLNENLEVIKAHMDYLTRYKYVNYAIVSQSKTLIKGVNVYHDNDLLAFRDEDRNYTGGGVFEVTTDYLKMRFLPHINKDRWLSYQGILYGVEAYTPEIRDTTTFNSPTSYDSTDRPFASFKYWGRSKYRIHYKGIFRMKGFYKFGTIGGDVSNSVQSVIHRDVSGSVKPQGWDSQIGFPGRFAFQYDEYLETMLFSGQGDIWNHKRKITDSRLLSNINIAGKIGWHLGSQLNAFDFGLSISNKNFREQSGGNDIRLPKGKSFQYLLRAEINYRLVGQYTMLEGYSFQWLQFFNQMNNEVDTYVLSSDQVVRGLFWGGIWAGIRANKMTLFYQYSFIEGEFIIDSIRTPTHYWGTIGINFLM